MKTLLLKLGINDIASARVFIWQFVKFGIVGLSNTILSLAIYYVLVFSQVHYLIAHTIAFMVSVLNAYYWNRKYVFKQMDGNKYKQLAKVYAAYGFTFFLGMGLMFIIVDVIGISNLVAPIINLCVTVPLNFILNKYWSFR